MIELRLGGGSTGLCLCAVWPSRVVGPRLVSVSCARRVACARAGSGASLACAGCGPCGGVRVGVGAWCGVAWWVRRSAGRGLYW